MLYQVVDDVVGNIERSTSSTGKEALARPRAPKGVAAYSVRLRARLSDADHVPLVDGDQGARVKLTPEEAARARDELTALGVRERCRAHVKQFRDEAIASLQATGCDSPEMAMLQMMTNLCAEKAGVAASS